MTAKTLHTLEEIVTEGNEAYRRGDKLIPVNNAMVWETIKALNPIVGDPLTIKVFTAFEKGWMEAQDEDLKAQGLE